MQILEELLAKLDWKTVISSGLRIVLVLAVAWVLVRTLGALLSRAEKLIVKKGTTAGEVPTEAAKRAETLGRLIRQALVIGLWAMAILIILSDLGVNIGPVIASLGVAGLAVGFGAQNLVRDVIAGFFFILENQVRVGDTVVVNGTAGAVERLNFRTLVLRDAGGVVHIFPNGIINSISNMTKEWSAHVFRIGIGYQEDTDRAVEVMRRVGEELRSDPRFGPLLIADIEIGGVDDFTDSAVMIQGRLKTVPGKQHDVGREFKRRLKKAFDAEGIEIPFPQVSLHFAQGSRPIQAQLVSTPQTEEARG